MRAKIITGKEIALALLVALLAFLAGAAAWALTNAGADKAGALSGKALELQVELSRLSSNSNNGLPGGDPFEREALLRKIIEQCAGTEEAEAAYWTLADLYLDAFPEPREEDARKALELFLKRCPESRWATQTKCRLLALYDAKDKRAAELRRELGADKSLPPMLRAALKL